MTPRTVPSMLMPLLLLCLSLGACAPDFVNNAQRMTSLSQGMTPSQVDQAMLGAKHKREWLGVSNLELEFWLYTTGYDNQSGNYLCDPVVFENGRLIGWGKNYTDRRLDIGNSYRQHLCLEPR